MPLVVCLVYKYKKDYGGNLVNQLIFSDEIKSVSNYVRKCIDSYKQINYKNVYVIADNNPVADYIIPAFSANFSDGGVTVVDAFKSSSIAHDFCKANEMNIECISLESFKGKSKTDNCVFLLLCDANNCDEKWFDIIDICEQKAKELSRTKIIVGVVLPKLRPIPDGIQALAEREYSYYIESVVTDRTDAENFYINLEKKCRKVVNDGYHTLNVMRFDNLIGANCAKTPNFDFEEIIKNAFATSKVEITKEDFCTTYSVICTRDAACAFAKSIYCTKDGHIYNLTYYNATIADLKTHIFKGFPDKVSYSFNTEACSEDDMKYYCLSRLKSQNHKCFSKKTIYPFKEAMYRTIAGLSDNEYNVQKKLTCYQGKLQRLKDIEIDILAEIDRICKKHDIKWFLAGGSLLGAIRENKSIPWDDDLDIGMLREDFEKFKRVAPQELDKKYYYSSPWTDENCHYYIDKIRLKSSYFSTAYSSHFRLEDGVFVDIIVYDQTSSNRLLEKLQIKMICFMVAALRIRWYNAPKKPRYKFWKHVFPILKHVPWKVLHKLFDFSATMFSKNKKAEYLLDSTGQHIRYGRFPKYYLEELTETELDGLMCPIPVHYHEYLSFFYGDNYFPKPSISSQVGAHKIARLDLGEFTFEDKRPGDFREVDIYGELFEEELE